MKLLAAAGGSINGIDFARLCSEQGLGKLYSVKSEHQYIERYHFAETLFNDSGAHSWTKHNINPLGIPTDSKPKIKVKTHADFLLRFIDKHKHKKWVFAELDAYHSEDLGIDYVNEMAKVIMQMQREGNFTFLRVYHPYIDEAQGLPYLTTLRKWIYEDGHTYIGISNDSHVRGLYGEIFNITRDKIRLHGFAKSGKTIIERYPFYSVDSTSALVIPFMYQYIPISYGEKLTRTEAIKNKDIRYHLYWEAERRLRQSIKVQKEAEVFYTKLWASRGVVWEDLYKKETETI